MWQVHIRTGKLRIAELSMAQEASFATAIPLGASCTPWGANGPHPRKRRVPDVAKSNYLRGRMLKIIACDDDVAFLDRLHRMIDRWSTETGTAVDVALVTRGEDLLARHAASRADIILLDMIMPLVNGMDTARELRQADTAVRLVFLTSSPEFALESYEVRAFDYLLKPVTYERLAQLLDELSSMRPAATDELVIKTSFGYHALRLSDIEYAEARNKHVVFHLRDERDIEALESFRSVEDRLEQNAVFFKCHRSYQVNLRNIDHFDRTDIVMRSGACIPLSRSCKQGFQDAYFAARFEGGRH